MENKKHNNDEPAVATAAPPEPPKPYPAPGYPKVVFNKAGNAPPRIVNNDEELAALNPKEWTQIPPVEPKEKVEWPRAFYNINNPPRMMSSEAEAEALGMAWRDLEDDFPVTVKVKTPKAAGK